MKKELEPVTLETVRNAKPLERQKIKQQREDWLNRERKNDRLELRRINNKIRRLDPEVRKRDNELVQIYQQRPEIKERRRKRYHARKQERLDNE